jgi:hypothetical protein
MLSSKQKFLTPTSLNKKALINVPKNVKYCAKKVLLVMRVKDMCG